MCRLAPAESSLTAQGCEALSGAGVLLNLKQRISNRGRFTSVEGLQLGCRYVGPSLERNLHSAW
ncbi:UNVERIFIED_CONTAM: hypothetical protein FKN15_009358 [Acipenser sinensis]